MNFPKIFENFGKIHFARKSLKDNEKTPKNLDKKFIWDFSEEVFFSM